MSKKRTAPASSTTKLSAQDAQAEDTRRRLRYAVKRAKEIKSLSKQLQRLNDEAQRALLGLATDVAARSEAIGLRAKIERAVGQ